MVVDACVPSGTAQRETFRILATLGIGELLGEAKINRVEGISLPTDPHQEVIRLDIAMEEALRMDVLDSRDGLVGDEEDGLERSVPTRPTTAEAKRDSAVTRIDEAEASRADLAVNAIPVVDENALDGM